MLYRLKSHLLRRKHSTTPAPIPVVDYPDWVLWQRIDWARQHDHHRQCLAHAQIRQQVLDRQRRVLRLSAEECSEAAVRAALARLAELGGGQLYLPEGDIHFSQSLHLSSHIALIGSQGRTCLCFDGLDYGLWIQGTDAAPVESVTLRDLALSHDGGPQFCATVLVTHCRDLRCQRVTITAPRAVGFLLADRVIGSHFEQCKVSHAGLVGFMLVRDVHETVMQQCVAEYCQQGGMFLTDLKCPKSIAPLDFQAQLHHTDQVIGNFAPFAPDDPFPYRTDMIDCVLRGNRKMGITTDGVGYLSVRNCVIADNDCEGITLDNGSFGCAIQNCHIYNNGWRGCQTEQELGIDFVQAMGLMDDGSSKAKLPGVSLDNAVDTRIEHNHIEANWGDGVKLVRAAMNTTITGNVITDNNRGVNEKFHFFGVLLGQADRQHPEQADFPSCNNTVAGNLIQGTHFAGVHIMLNSRGNQVRNNTIKGATFAAIEDHMRSGNQVE
ncbi:MAG: right-handed parallel beta-helix repeat-containing protein [Methylococcales bacterium]|nr:right-handed parallel beta-helix repeat-containing protein [Methylococcales bacterium]